MPRQRHAQSKGTAGGGAPCEEGAAHAAVPTLRARRLGIDTLQEAVVYMRRDCSVCRSEGFAAQARVVVHRDARSCVATLYVVTSDLIAHGDAGLSEAAWRLLGASEGDVLTFSHPKPLLSLGAVRGKVNGKRLTASALDAIVRDVAAGRYSDVQLSAVVTAFATGGLNRREIVALTRAMIVVGDRLSWGQPLVVDKHCVGGLPGNRTTLVVVPIVTAAGLVMPKTSSRAITSPAGTADTMETLAPVDLDAQAMRRVVEKEGGCIAWGGAMHLSPADDALIRVERPLELDAPGQLVASVLSKKVAAGATHVVIDIPVGETAKVRSMDAAASLGADLQAVGKEVGLDVTLAMTDGRQPVGRGIGPSLEARDVMAVLERRPDAPSDLRERSLMLAGRLLELSSDVPQGGGLALATAILDDGRALAKLVAICDAQGGLREPPRASFTSTLEAARAGRVDAVDNRALARIAKLAGAPDAKAAGIDYLVRLGQTIAMGQPMFTIHAATIGELGYALAYARSVPDVVRLS